MIHWKDVPQQVVKDLRSGWRQIVRDMGGVDACAKVAKTTISQVSIYGNPDGDSLPSLATVLAVEMDLGTGHAHFTEAMARATGHILVPVKAVTEGDLDTLLAKLGGETGDVFTRYAMARSDGVVSAEARAALVCELEDVIQAAHCAIGHLRQPPKAVARSEDAA
jgi:hypothetical protein